jgi:hypothetical protein
VTENEPNTSQVKPLPSLLLPCITNHRRYLPTPAKHGFSYPLIYLGIDLDQLESNQLDLSSRFFRYGTSHAVLGIKHEQYLAPQAGPKSNNIGAWREELKGLVKEHGVDSESIGRIWLVTMPSYVGWVGVNPLSVYFCYQKSDGEEDGLLCVVLEVHNTFEERLVHRTVVSGVEGSRLSRSRLIDISTFFERATMRSTLKALMITLGFSLEPSTSPRSTTVRGSTVSTFKILSRTVPRRHLGSKSL